MSIWIRETPLRCSSVSEWINKQNKLYVQTIEYYSALKTYELLNHEKTFINLRCISLTERN